MEEKQVNTSMQQPSEPSSVQTQSVPPPENQSSTNIPAPHDSSSAFSAAGEKQPMIEKSSVASDLKIDVKAANLSSSNNNNLQQPNASEAVTGQSTAINNNNNANSQMEEEKTFQVPVAAQQGLQQQQQQQQQTSASSPNKFPEVYNEFKIALQNGNIQKVKDILEKYNKDFDLVNRIDPQTRQISTYIAVLQPDDHVAAQVLKLLLEHGANPQFKDQIDQTILFYIAKYGKIECFELLMQQQQNVQQQQGGNNNNGTSNYNNNLNDPDKHGQTPIFYAAVDGRLEIIRKMKEHGAVCNVVDGICQQTALFYAAREGHTEICKFLIENGCKVNHQDATKKNALNYARKFNRRETIELLNQKSQQEKEEMKRSQTQSSTGHAHQQQQQQQQQQKASKDKERFTGGAGGFEKSDIIMNNNSNKDKDAGYSASTSQVSNSNNNNINLSVLKEKDAQLLKDNTNAIKEPQSDSHNNNTRDDEEEKKSLKKRKREKDTAKVSYKLVYTDENGNSEDINVLKFNEQFKLQYPKLADLLINADSEITEELINQCREKDSWEKTAKKLIQNIWKLKGCYLFQQPVDVKKYQIDDYLEIVKNPMDFGTIKQKLTNNVYGNCQEFLQDMDLVFSNCLLYNGTECEVGRTCLYIQDEYKKQCELLKISEFLDKNHNYNKAK